VVSNNQSFVGLVRAVLDEAGVLVRGSHDWNDVVALVEDVEPAVLALDLSGNQEKRWRDSSFATWVDSARPAQVTSGRGLDWRTSPISWTSPTPV